VFNKWKNTTYLFGKQYMFGADVILIHMQVNGIDLFSL